ncbi:MAG: glycosyltransferase [Chroococcales cyanobacterium]
MIRVAFLVKLTPGGIERIALTSLQALAKLNLSLDLVNTGSTSPQMDFLPDSVRVIHLHRDIESSVKRSYSLILPLTDYLRKEHPDILISHLVYVNFISIIARFLAQSSSKLILVEHLPLLSQLQPEKQQLKTQNRQTQALLIGLRRLLYPLADQVVAVSNGIAELLAADLKMKPSSIRVIYNPVMNSSLLEKAQESIEHPWFECTQPPVIIANGRLAVEKDYPTLIKAFALLRQKRPAHLLILGEGNLRPSLERLIEKYQLTSEVSLLGFVTNPYVYMRRASVLVLSSRWEGLPTVLIEALAVGCQVVSTDCPYGPAEILAEGTYGRLVPMGDVEALAAAMAQALDNPINPELLKKRSQEFSVEKAVSQYLKLMEIEA